MDPKKSDQVRAELQRILDFTDMKSSRQLSRFLEFVVDEALAGRESRIKERTIAIGALERDDDFDPRFDAIVRIVAGKLRRTLDRYYQSDGAADEFRITIPKGGYVPTFVRTEDIVLPDSAAASSQPGVRTNILLVDDHRVLRSGLHLLLDAEHDLHVVGEADDGEAAIELARTLSPEVVVMDIAMPNMTGVDATRHILSHRPETKVIALSVHAGHKFVDNMLRAGARGYVLKESAPEELVTAIRSVVQGQVYLSPSVTGTLVSRYVDAAADGDAAMFSSELTTQQKNMVRLIVEGHSTGEAAAKMGVSPDQGERIARHLMQRVGVQTIEELATYAQTAWAGTELDDDDA